jgi:UDP-N-acetylglucosamine 2-epimerase (non-hydrolysing)
MQRQRPKILVSFGTRPEAIKMFPVIAALKAQPGINTRVAVSAQHRGLLDQVLQIADIKPEIDLDLMRESQGLSDLAARMLTEFDKVLNAERPDRVLVHGDTLTTAMVAQASYFRRIPVGHVEAGLRSGDIYAPWPEEVNRKITTAIADMHFAPTQLAADALRTENVPASSIHVTGNTVIDALKMTQRKLAECPDLAPQIAGIRQRAEGKRIIVVTAHRRENFGGGMQDIANALLRLAQRGDVAIVYPLHPNPAVSDPMRRALTDHPNIELIEPLDYPSFVALLDLSALVLTDSGGIQEEAPALGKPVLVMRTTTERPEGITAGTAKLVGTDCDQIVRQASELLDVPESYAAMAAAHNPYGDGHAAQRIARIIAGNC